MLFFNDISVFGILFAILIQQRFIVIVFILLMKLSSHHEFVRVSFIIRFLLKVISIVFTFSNFVD